MKTAVALAAALLLPAATHAAAAHHCADDAKARASGLLRLHFEGEDLKLAPGAGAPADGDSGEMMNWSISDEATVLPPVRAPVGKGKFDVIEVYGFIYKAEYRMHFLYAQIEDTCALMGQEIIEMSDPY